jgi:hypothetical protein
MQKKKTKINNQTEQKMKTTKITKTNFTSNSRSGMRFNDAKSALLTRKPINVANASIIVATIAPIIRLF